MYQICKFVVRFFLRFISAVLFFTLCVRTWEWYKTKQNENVLTTKSFSNETMRFPGERKPNEKKKCLCFFFPLVEFVKMRMTQGSLLIFETFKSSSEKEQKLLPCEWDGFISSLKVNSKWNFMPCNGGYCCYCYYLRL